MVGVQRFVVAAADIDFVVASIQLDCHRTAAAACYASVVAVAVEVDDRSAHCCY